jgi:hypothetical protein
MGREGRQQQERSKNERIGAKATITDNQLALLSASIYRNLDITIYTYIFLKPAFWFLASPFSHRVFRVSKRTGNVQSCSILNKKPFRSIQDRLMYSH